MAGEHSNLLKKTLLALCKIPLTRAWRNESGTAKSFDGQRIIKFGLKGSSDILGISDSIFLAIEIKIGPDKQREEQKNFEKMITECKGFYFIVRNENDIKIIVERLSNKGNRSSS